MSNYEKTDWDNRSLGGLWRQKSKRTGDTFFTGQIEIDGRKINILAFRNTKKQEGERTPDYRLYEADYDEPNRGGENRSYQRPQGDNQRRGGGYASDRDQRQPQEPQRRSAPVDIDVVID